jgi:hypothetical protein
MTSCPICKGNYLDVFDSDLVCDYHEDWIITYCLFCKHHVFSPIPHICLCCLQELMLNDYIMQYLSVEIILGKLNGDT